MPLLAAMGVMTLALVVALAFVPYLVEKVRGAGRADKGIETTEAIPIALALEV